MANADELINSLTWGKSKKSLSRLLRQYQLPLIVRVVDSVQRTNGETCIHDGQVLVLHEIDSVRKLIGTDNLGIKITIPLSFPTQGLVQPSKCKYTSCRVEDFKAIFPKVQYVRVKRVDFQARNDEETSLKVGDFLQIKKIERKNKTVHCQNIDTYENIAISYTSQVIFTPFLDYQKYKLSEIVSNYELPVKVCFETTRSQEDENSEQTLKGLNQFVFHKEVSEAQLLATTVAGDEKATQCMGLPTELPIKCVVAKRTAENEASYNNVIESLQAEFNEKNATKRVTLFQDVHGVKLYDFTSLERPERSNAAKSSPKVSSNEPGRKLTESNTVARTPPAVSPKPKKRPTQPNNSATTPTAVSVMTKERFTDPEPPTSQIVPKSTSESFSNVPRTPLPVTPRLKKRSTQPSNMVTIPTTVSHMTKERFTDPELSPSTIVLKGSLESSSKVPRTPPPVTPRPKKRPTQPSNLATNPTAVSAMTKGRFTDPEPSPYPIVLKNTSESSCNDSKRKMQESEDFSSMNDDDYIAMGYVENVYEEVDCEKDDSLKTACLSLTGQPSTEQATSMNFNRECVNPKSIIKQKERPLSTESTGYVIPLVRSVNSRGRKFKVCKQNPYKNVCWGKEYYTNVFTDKKYGSNSWKLKINNATNTVHGKFSDDDEYVEVDNPYQNIEKRQKNTLLKTSSNEEMEPSVKTAKTQLKVEVQQDRASKQVSFM